MKTYHSLRTLMFVLMTLAFSFSAGTAMAAGGVLAKVTMSPSSIYWQPHGQYAQITLTVSGPDGITTQVFSGGVNPSFQVGSSADGNYKYELSVTPVINDAIRAQLREARATGDMSIVSDMKRQGVLPSGPTRQSGHFRIINGAIFVDATPEAGLNEK